MQSNKINRQYNWPIFTCIGRRSSTIGTIHDRTSCTDLRLGLPNLIPECAYGRIPPNPVPKQYISASFLHLPLTTSRICPVPGFLAFLRGCYCDGLSAYISMVLHRLTLGQHTLAAIFSSMLTTRRQRLAEFCIISVDMELKAHSRRATVPYVGVYNWYRCPSDTSSLCLHLLGLLDISSR